MALIKHVNKGYNQELQAYFIRVKIREYSFRILNTFDLGKTTVRETYSSLEK